MEHQAASNAERLTPGEIGNQTRPADASGACVVEPGEGPGHSRPWGRSAQRPAVQEWGRTQGDGQRGSASRSASGRTKDNPDEPHCRSSIRAVQAPRTSPRNACVSPDWPWFPTRFSDDAPQHRPPLSVPVDLGPEPSAPRDCTDTINVHRGVVKRAVASLSDPSHAPHEQESAVVGSESRPHPPQPRDR